MAQDDRIQGTLQWSPLIVLWSEEHFFDQCGCSIHQHWSTEGLLMSSHRHWQIVKSCWLWVGSASILLDSSPMQLLWDIQQVIDENPTQRLVSWRETLVEYIFWSFLGGGGFLLGFLSDCAPLAGGADACEYLHGESLIHRPAMWRLHSSMVGVREAI